MVARALKKQSRQSQRLAKARTKLTLASIAGAVEGCMVYDMLQILELNKKEKAQIHTVLRWTHRCLTCMQIGNTAYRQAIEVINSMDTVIKQHLAPVKHPHLGHYAALWIALSYLCDEARDRIVPDPWRYNWNYLAGCVATWTEMMLTHAPSRDIWEDRAGILADQLWPVVFDRPRGYFGR